MLVPTSLSVRARIGRLPAALRLRFRRTTVGRIVPVVAGVVLAGSALTGCHGPPHAVPVITGVNWPTSFFVTPDNTSIWYSERFSGEIHRRNLRTRKDVLVFTVPKVVGAGEQGLLGVALHPGFPNPPYLYAYATRQVGTAVRNQVLKITVSNGVGVASQVIFDSTAGTYHNGGRIHFGPDGMLYVVVGENTVKANAQDLGATNKAGKIHRITPDGGVPANNPIPGNTIWAYGIRNSFGFGFDPTNGQLWATDNGPECNDEVDRIIKGANYAWGPNETCSGPLPAPDNTNQDGPVPRRQPKHFYASTIAVTGVAFCSSCGLGSGAEGALLVGAANNGNIRRLTLDSARARVVSDNLLYDHTNAVLSVESRPGQPVYFSDPGAIYVLNLTG
jgi:glucose/arabinose dehydrogenase